MLFSGCISGCMVVRVRRVWTKLLAVSLRVDLKLRYSQFHIATMSRGVGSAEGSAGSGLHLALSSVIVQTKSPLCEKPLKFEVLYYDSKDNPVPKKDRISEKTDGSSLPVVLTLHGCPGNHKDFDLVVNALHQTGRVRVISPNFPGFGVTKPLDDTDEDCFDYGMFGKAQFILDFLKAVNIDKVDIGCGFSVGTPPLGYLCAKTDIFRSGLFVSPCPPCPHRANSPPILISGMEWLWRSPLRCLSDFILRKLYNSKGSTAAGKAQTEHLIHGIMSLTTKGMQYEQMKVNATTMKEKNFPVVFMYSERDQFIDVPQTEDHARLMGVTEVPHAVYEEGALVEQLDNFDYGAGQRHMKTVMFKGARHYAQRKQQNVCIIVREILDMLDSINQTSENRKILSKY